MLRDQMGRFIGQPKKQSKFELAVLKRLDDLEHDSKEQNKNIVIICLACVCFCGLLAVCFLRT